MKNSDQQVNHRPINVNENLSFLSRISQVKGGSTRELIAFWDTLHLRNQSDCSQNLGVPKPNLSRSLDLLSNNPSEQFWLHVPTKTLSKSLENLDACQGNTMQSKEITVSPPKNTESVGKPQAETTNPNGETETSESVQHLLVKGPIPKRPFSSIADMFETPKASKYSKIFVEPCKPRLRDKKYLALREDYSNRPNVPGMDWAECEWADPDDSLF